MLAATLTAMVGGAMPAQAADGNILPPFEIGQQWWICRGYNHGSHTGTSAYGIDLVGGPGCDNSAATGRTVKAPVGGTVYYYEAAHGNLCINKTGGGSYTLTHINPSVTSGAVAAGQVVGTVAAPQPNPDIAPMNNNVAHIHFQMWATANCYSGGNGGIPFDAAHGIRICGAPDLYAAGPVGTGNGTWSGTSFVGQNCGGSSQGLQAPSAITDPSTGRNIFYVGADGYIWQWSIQNGQWTNVKLTALSGGQAVAANTSPTAIYDSASGRNVFYVGADNAIWQWSVQNGQWTNVRLGGSVAPDSSPSAVADTTTGRNVFYVGANGAINQWSIQNGQWTNVSFGGTALGGTSPSAIADPATGRNVFYVGLDSKISQWSVQNGQWTNVGLSGMGGNKTVASHSSPSAVADTTTGRNVFYVGSDSFIYQWSVQNGQWTNFALTGTGGNEPAAQYSSPSVTVDNSTGRNIFYVGANHQIYQWSIQNGAWNNFMLTGAGGNAAADSNTSPGAIVDASTGTGRNAFYFNTGRIYQWSIQNGQWTNFQLQ
jgi:hypothetical protein